MTLRERAIFAAAMMVLCGVALLVAARDGYAVGADAAACVAPLAAVGFGASMVLSVAWWGRGP